MTPEEQAAARKAQFEQYTRAKHGPEAAASPTATSAPSWSAAELDEIAVVLVKSVIETAIAAASPKGTYVLVTERFWKMIVVRHDTEAAARAHAARLWACCVVAHEATPGKFQELLAGGLSSALTTGAPHKRIRAHIAATLGPIG